MLDALAAAFIPWLPGWLELPAEYVEGGLAKGLQHKYIKRVPSGVTKTGKVRYRYFYKVGHGGTVRTAQVNADATLIAGWLRTLPKTTINSGPALMAKFNDSPLADHFEWRKSAFGTDNVLRPKAGGVEFHFPASEGFGRMAEYVMHYADNPQSDWPSTARAAHGAMKKGSPLASLAAALGASPWA